MDMDDVETCDDFFYVIITNDDDDEDCRNDFRKMFKTYFSPDQILSDLPRKLSEELTVYIAMGNRVKWSSVDFNRNTGTYRHIVHLLERAYGLNDVENPYSHGDKKTSTRIINEILERINFIALGNKTYG
jgi:hypothetical protein